MKLFSRKQQAVAVPDAPRPVPRPIPSQQADYESAAPLSLPKDPLQRELELGRYGSIVRQRKAWRDHADIDKVYRVALGQIDDQFSLVPEGFVSMPLTVNDIPGCPEEDAETSAYLLAKYTVTQGQYQKFVDGGGYEDMELWPRDIWPHLIDFKDLTGEPGPRFWRGGRHDRRYEHHPVVGVSFYEAAAFAKWAGYRLPTEAEWQMAGSWRIRSSAHVLRRYPWGDALDTNRCNIWSSGVGGIVPVHAYESGAAPNGVLQLIGNVWEWTDADFTVTDDEGRPVVGDMILKSIRGGAFDTYFPSQATSVFRTGLASLSRAHNVGFRCAMDLGKD